MHEELHFYQPSLSSQNRCVSCNFYLEKTTARVEFFITNMLFKCATILSFHALNISKTNSLISIWVQRVENNCLVV